MYLVSPCTHLPKNADPSLLKSCYQKTFDDGTHSTLSPALHFQGPRPPSWYYLAVTPLSGAMGIFKLRFVQIWVRGLKSWTKFSKVWISQKLWDQYCFALCESTRRARRQDWFHCISEIYMYWVIELLMDFPRCSHEVNESLYWKLKPRVKWPTTAQQHKQAATKWTHRRMRILNKIVTLNTDFELLVCKWWLNKFT